MSASLLLLFGLGSASLATSFVSGILGMAGGMLLMGILLAVLPVAAAMTLHGITQFTSNAGRAWMLRSQVQWSIALGYAGGAAIAWIAFALVQLRLGKGAALLVMGGMPFVGLALPRRLRLDVMRRGHAAACGLVCMGISLTAGIAGPILDLFFVRSAMGRREVVATKAFTQASTHLAKVAYFGLLVREEAELPVILAAVMVVLAIAGTRLSKGVLERMSDASFRQWTRATLMALGVAYVGAGLVLLRG